MNAEPSYLDLPVGRFLGLLAGPEPAPSGGGAAALAVSMAASLCAMTARLSTRQLSTGDAETLTRDMERVAATAASLVQADADSYAGVIAARRSAGAKSEQAAVALAAAADVPMEITELAVPVAHAAARLAADGNPNLRGDAVTGALLAAAGARAAAVLVEINLADQAEDSRRALAARLAGEAAALAAAVAQPSPGDHPGPGSGLP
jgi:methenyltetrahydrofolate cyclohydrolase